MTTVAIIQARCGSSRLPEKVLRDVAGKPLLARVIERVSAIPGLEGIVVATSDQRQDVAVLDLARRCGVRGFAGSEQDVLDRYYQVAKDVGAEVIMRVTGDCPLLDPVVSTSVLKRFFQGGVDYASNTRPPTYPDGLDTEVFSFAALERAWHNAVQSAEREHVTAHIWNRPYEFRLGNVVAESDLSAYRWTVDEPRDLELVEMLCRRLDGEGLFGMDKILNLLAAEPALGSINAHIGRNEGYARSLGEKAL